MDAVISLCAGSIQYPLNFASSYIPEYLQASYNTQITKHQQRLFVPEKEAILTFWELGNDSKAFWRYDIHSASRLESHLRVAQSAIVKPDPRCRFLQVPYFFHWRSKLRLYNRFLRAAGNSRRPLNTTRKMLTLSLTYFQVMPEFLDFLFLFGKQDQAKDLYFSGFRQQTRLTGKNVGMKVAPRNWSGHNLQLCYSLKSVEHSGSQIEWPWSIRHCAVHYAFDAETIRSTWIIIKGNELMERRIQSASSESGPCEPSSFETIDRAFAVALETHLIMCDWSVENWRWYIRFLEERFEELTEGTISINADVPMAPTNGSYIMKALPHTDSIKTLQSTRSRTSSFKIPFRLTRTGTLESISSSEKEAPMSPHIYTSSGGKKQMLPPGVRPVIQGPQLDKYGQRQFSFSDLQHVQDIEEKANETVVVLNLNQNVISQLKRYYTSIIESQELPEAIRKKCKGDIIRFERRIDGITSDMTLQILRVEALLRSLADRKTLLYGILDYQNMQASKLLVAQSRKSTRNMEHMTRNMAVVARKTKTETVSMKIITLVTLFFLPGTFISTLMSTDIVHWKDGERNYQPEALKVYLYVSLPFMFFTFVVWALFQFFEKRKERKDKLKLREAMEKSDV